MPKSASPKPIHIIYPNNPGNMGLETSQMNPWFNHQGSSARRIRHYKNRSFRNPLEKPNKSKKGGRQRRRKTVRRSRSKK